MQRLLPILILAISILQSTSSAQENRCDSSNYHLLDFWVGEWNVYWTGKLVGKNKIEKVLRDCAIIEHWTDVDGREGKSVFYVDLATQNWKQVWVTDAGSMKEKSLQRVNSDGSVLFQGQIVSLNGKVLLDRTTLYPVKNGKHQERVRQVIEQSEDNGKTWRIVFDGLYFPQS